MELKEFQLNAVKSLFEAMAIPTRELFSKVLQVAEKPLF